MSPHVRRDLLRRWVVIGLSSAVLAGCMPSEVLPPPSERREAAAETKTPPPKGMKPQENFDPRKAAREKAEGKDVAKSTTK